MDYMGTFEEMKYKYTDLVLILHLNGKTLIGHHCCCFLQNCTNIECLQISCVVGRLGGGESAVLKVRSRLWAKTFLQVRKTLQVTIVPSAVQQDLIHL